MNRRRDFLRACATAAGCLLVAKAAGGVKIHNYKNSTLVSRLGPLQPPDISGVRLPPGFRSRVIARSGQRPVPSSAYRWHGAPDGGGVFPLPDGGWVYVSNSELGRGQGGAGALRFNAGGTVVDAYPILHHTHGNCGGGTTPWGTWLSCEEVKNGQVWECDSLGQQAAKAHPALGLFKHESITFDAVRQQFYLTEDETDGRFYRFTPATLNRGGALDLSRGRLEVAHMANRRGGTITWLALPDPLAEHTPTRRQVKESMAFDGGEGVWYHDNTVYMTTKGDDRVWAYDAVKRHMTILYDADTHARPILTGVDNIIVSTAGDILVAEDGGDMQIVALTPAGNIKPLLQLVGHTFSEITGLALSPSEDRLYFSSQRGKSGTAGGGITYEIRGPFVAADK